MRKNIVVIILVGSSALALSTLRSQDAKLAAAGPSTSAVSLLDGKLKLDIPSDFSRDANDPKNPKTMA